ncbi:hypothetical protein J6590_058355 [Homalodisca vitripennis]|nr:hypothetical protein J6590_058355 [Homalodisca vitripennis]
MFVKGDLDAVKVSQILSSFAKGSLVTNRKAGVEPGSAIIATWNQRSAGIPSSQLFTGRPRVKGPIRDKRVSARRVERIDLSLHRTLCVYRVQCTVYWQSRCGGATPRAATAVLCFFRAADRTPPPLDFLLCYNARRLLRFGGRRNTAPDGFGLNMTYFG